jgi:hypothetical protein
VRPLFGPRLALSRYRQVFTLTPRDRFMLLACDGFWGVRSADVARGRGLVVSLLMGARGGGTQAGVAHTDGGDETGALQIIRRRPIDDNCSSRASD